ncbi:MAG: polyketide cyclase [Acidimicrobiales bacterium]|nr:MAG: polyketide cyclase [Acidimicrobiales bacterium]
MIEVSRTVATTAERVFAVLADGWSYAGWVVGASHIRQVEDGWPAVNTCIHHNVGPWPLQVKDVTRVRAIDPGRMLELEARVWPFGAARVRLTLNPVGQDATEVCMAEALSSGTGQLIPEVVQGLILRPRNIESLRRLGDIAVHREAER